VLLRRQPRVLDSRWIPASWWDEGVDGFGDGGAWAERLDGIAAAAHAGEAKPAPRSETVE
jgi:hypothetical protein